MVPYQPNAHKQQPLSTYASKVKEANKRAEDVGILGPRDEIPQKPFIQPAAALEKPSKTFGAIDSAR